MPWIDLPMLMRHASPPRLDLQIDAAKLGTEYLRLFTDEHESRLSKLDADSRTRAEQEIESARQAIADRERQTKKWEADLKKNFEQYVNVAAGLTSPVERAAVARRYGLIREAIAELRKKQDELQKLIEAKKTLSPPELAMQLAAHAELIELMMYDGRVEEAAQIDTIDNPDTMEAMTTEPVRQNITRFAFARCECSRLIRAIRRRARMTTTPRDTTKLLPGIVARGWRLRPCRRSAKAECAGDGKGVRYVPVQNFPSGTASHRRPAQHLCARNDQLFSPSSLQCRNSKVKYGSWHGHGWFSPFSTIANFTSIG